MKMALTNAKKVWIGIVLVLIAALALYVCWPEDNLSELKKVNHVQPSAQQREYVEKLLGFIEKDDMQSLFKEMAVPDKISFDGKYSEGLFAEKDFCPAKIVGATQLQKTSYKEDISIHVRSIKRKKAWQFVLTPRDGSWKIRWIVPSDKF